MYVRAFTRLLHIKNPLKIFYRQKSCCRNFVQLLQVFYGYKSFWKSFYKSCIDRPFSLGLLGINELVWGLYGCKSFIWSYRDKRALIGMRAFLGLMSIENFWLQVLFWKDKSFLDLEVFTAFTSYLPWIVEVLEVFYESKNFSMPLIY